MENSIKPAKSQKESRLDYERKKQSWKEFEKELTSLLNKYSLDARFSTPDFILAGIIMRFMIVWSNGLNKTKRWYAWKGL